MEVTFIYNDKTQFDRLGDTSKYSPSFCFLDSGSNKTRKKALKVKSYYAARLEPFAIITDNEKPIKAFYSEAEDVVDSLIKYLDENESRSN